MPDSYMEAEKRDASLILIGDLCVEPMAPAFHVEGWDNMPIGRFFNRFGQRFHSIAWYVDEGMQDLYARIHAAGVRTYTTGGQPVTGDEAPRTLFTHPRDTCTQLEFVPGDIGDSVRDPRFRPGWTPLWWAERHPLGIQRYSHVTVTTRDLAKAKEMYVGVLAGTLLHEGDGSPGASSAFVLLGDTVVELAAPVDTSSAIGRHLERWHEGIYSITYQVANLEEAESYLDRKGVKMSHRDEHTMTTDPATSQGCVLGFTTRAIPGDRRPAWGDAVPAQ
jgi:catechol 2,3-dioxygenase-like lactoylglutathione lyase family enzyme